MIAAAFAPAWEALTRRLDSRHRPPLAVALSGGSDSLGLLMIAKGWANVAQRPLFALTVDHGLHPDSRHWTEAAGEAASRLGVPWRALAWTGAKPANGLPAAARGARHALLAEATRAGGACVLLLGHTADDVAESELIRRETPTHGRLAEWSPSPAWPEGRGVFLLRPLLSSRRADLRRWLSARSVAWLDDPANSDLRFARSRARRALAETARTEGRAEACARPAPVERPRLEIAQACQPHGALEFDAATLLEWTPAAQTLAKMLVCVAGRSRPPAGVTLQRLLSRLAVSEPMTTTLSGAKLHAVAGRVRLTREFGRSPPSPLSLIPRRLQVFDGRFELQAQAPGWLAVTLGGHSAGLPRRERETLRDHPPDVRPTVPALLGPGGEIRLPQPFGGGPATADYLVGRRLAAALGLVASESALEQASQARQARGAKPALVLS